MTSHDKPLPISTQSTSFWWDAVQREELWAQRSVSTGEYVFYPRTVSPFSVHDTLEWVRCSGLATLDSYIVNERPLAGFSAPQVLGIVRLQEGPRMLSEIVGVDEADLALDLPLEVTFERRDETLIPVFSRRVEA